MWGGADTNTWLFSLVLLTTSSHLTCWCWAEPDSATGRRRPALQGLLACHGWRSCGRNVERQWSPHRSPPHPSSLTHLTIAGPEHSQRHALQGKQTQACYTTTKTAHRCQTYDNYRVCGIAWWSIILRKSQMFHRAIVPSMYSSLQRPKRLRHRSCDFLRIKASLDFEEVSGACIRDHQSQRTPSTQSLYMRFHNPLNYSTHTLKPGHRKTKVTILIWVVATVW